MTDEPADTPRSPADTPRTPTDAVIDGAAERADAAAPAPLDASDDDVTEPRASVDLDAIHDDVAEPGATVDLDAIERDLAAVEAALDRLSDGSYWLDEVTGEPLADDLLAADPTARRTATS